MKIVVGLLIAFFLLSGCAPKWVIAEPVTNMDKVYKNEHLSLLSPEGVNGEWMAKIHLSGSFSFRMRPGGDNWSQYTFGVYLSELDPKSDWFDLYPKKVMEGDESVGEWGNLRKNPYEFVFIDGIRCVKMYNGVSQQGANLKTVSQRNKYYGSQSNKIQYSCPLVTESGKYKLVRIDYWADFMNPSIEQGTDVNKSFADLNRRVQRSINSLKISRKDYFRNVNYRIIIEK